jgi:hypothetical protein
VGQPAGSGRGAARSVRRRNRTWHSAAPEPTNPMSDDHVCFYSVGGVWAQAKRKLAWLQGTVPAPAKYIM